MGLVCRAGEMHKNYLHLLACYASFETWYLNKSPWCVYEILHIPFSKFKTLKLLPAPEVERSVGLLPPLSKGTEFWDMGSESVQGGLLPPPGHSGCLPSVPPLPFHCQQSGGAGKLPSSPQLSPGHHCLLLLLFSPGATSPGGLVSYPIACPTLV